VPLAVFEAALARGRECMLVHQATRMARQLQHTQVTLGVYESMFGVVNPAQLPFGSGRNPSAVHLVPEVATY